ncbi:MAG: hypothetical protein ACREEC_05075, partial [Thermoplasmata archaeon]
GWNTAYHAFLTGRSIGPGRLDGRAGGDGRSYERLGPGTGRDGLREGRKVRQEGLDGHLQPSQ